MLPLASFLACSPWAASSTTCPLTQRSLTRDAEGYANNSLDCPAWMLEGRNTIHFSDLICDAKAPIQKQRVTYTVLVPPLSVEHGSAIHLSWSSDANWASYHLG